MQDIKDFYNGLPLYGKIIFWAVIAVIIIYVYRKVIVHLQALKTEQLSNSTVNYTQNGQTTTIDLGGKALKIYDAFYNYYGGMAEDEETAISTLQSVPTQLVPKLSQIYFDLYAKTLKEDFTKFLSASEYNKISNKFI